MLSNFLLIDIETIPQAPSFLQLNDNWQTLWKEKLARFMESENLTAEESYAKRGGILAEFGKIICISTAYFYYDTNNFLCLKLKSFYGHNEAEVLSNFTTLCNKLHKNNPNFLFAGHNIKEFDIPFICRRILANNLNLPQYFWLHDKKPWETKMLDTLSWWKFGDNKNYTSLHLLANVLGIPTSKAEMDGSQVQQVYYKENDLTKIVRYCQADVIVTAKIILKFKGIPVFREENVFVVE